MEYTESILKTMTKAAKPLKAGEIAELSKIDKATVDKAIKELLKQNKVISPKRCFYEIKK